MYAPREYFGRRTIRTREPEYFAPPVNAWARIGRQVLTALRDTGRALIAGAGLRCEPVALAGVANQFRDARGGFGDPAFSLTVDIRVAQSARHAARVS